MKRGTALIAALALCAMPVVADDRIDHYAAEESATLAEALENFSTFNNRVEAVLTRPVMTRDNMEDIHQLTYTLEVALERIIAEATELADLLEEVHLASEGADAEKLIRLTTSYLAISRQLVP